MLNTLQAAAAEYLAHGWHLVDIPAGRKGPTSRGWNIAAGGVKRAAALTGNVGLAHAYSGTCALDFDKLDAARTWLAAHGIDLDALLDAPDAVRITSGRPNRAKLLYRLAAPLPSKQIKDAGETLLEFRCATEQGTTVQDVLPPSVHPDTGRPYAWAYGDELVGHWSALPPLPAPVLALWQSLNTTTEPPPPATGPTLDGHALRAALAHIDPSCGYDDWIRAGMASHHASGGAGYGLQAWDEWSAGSSKYPGSPAIAAKWESFGRDTGGLVTAQWLLAQGVATADDFEPLPPAPQRFHFSPANEVAERPLPGWIVKGVLPAAALAVVYGASGDGKTFFVLDMAASIVLGTPWRDRKTKQGRVAYLCAEGAQGFRKRLKAYRTHHGVSLDGLFVHEGAPNLLLPADVNTLVTSLKACGPLRVVIIDTASRTMPGGNENASEDMGRLIAAAGRIHAATGALVVFVHHSGKDASKGARGWSGLRAACDAEIEVTRADDGARCASLSKQKDDTDEGRLGFKLHIVEIGADEDGEPVTSCVVVECEAPEAKRGRPGADEGRTQAQTAFEAVRIALELSDAPMTGNEARALIAATEPFASMDSRHRAGNVSRALQQAVDKGWLRSDAGVISRG